MVWRCAGMKMMIKRWSSLLWAILLVGALVGCSTRVTAVPGSPTPTSTVSPSLTPTVEPTDIIPPATETPIPTPPPTPTPQMELPQYQISAQLDYAALQVSVVETITIQNPAQQELASLSLAVPPNTSWWPNVFRLQDLSWQDGEKITEYSLEGVRLKIPIREAWFPGQSRDLTITYTLSLPEMNKVAGVGPSPFGYSRTKDNNLVKQINLVDWYPFLPPYQEGNGWIIHDPQVYGEYLVYPQADFDVSLQILNGPNDLVVAASSLDRGGEGSHRYQLEEARNFVLSLSPYYQVLETGVNGTQVLGYHFPFYENAGGAAFQTTVDALRLYADLYAPYPQSSLTMVQADFDHGMEYEGLYFLNRSFFNGYNDSPSSMLVAIAAHETAHQWWYGSVANDQALEPWLDEAICTYHEKIYLETYYPEAVAWWWDNRVNVYQPKGVIDRSIYETQSYLDYRDTTYLQGAHFMEDLRDTIGDEAFFSFLKAYAEAYAGKIATGDDFFNLLETYAEVDLRSLVDRYFQDRP